MSPPPAMSNGYTWRPVTARTGVPFEEVPVVEWTLVVVVVVVAAATV